MRYVILIATDGSRSRMARSIAARRAHRGRYRQIDLNTYQDLGSVGQPSRVTAPLPTLRGPAWGPSVKISYRITDATPGRAVLPPPPGWAESVRGR